MQDNLRSLHCIDMFKRYSSIPGDVAECGVAVGQTTFMLDEHVLIAKKQLYAFDTFSGLPYDDQIISEHQCKRGEMNYGEEFFRKLSDIQRIRQDLNYPGKRPYRRNSSIL